MPAADVRASMAAHLLGDRIEPPPLGDIVLHAHQRLGVMRVQRLLDNAGGALLADDVGLGKTFVALAVARAVQRVVVIVPASLRNTWAIAASRTGVDVRIVSAERLSRPHPPLTPGELVIIDEAHHFRNAGTRRFAAAAELCRNAKVLLLSATPVHNRVRDLQTLMSLFLGARAFAFREAELSRFVVRREEHDASPDSLRLPRVHPPRWVDCVQDIDCLDRLLALPRAQPPADGDDGGVLLVYTLARQWASSRAALTAALRRRIATGSALLDALRAGKRPSRAQLAAWTYADGTQQLAFPELVASDAPAGLPVSMEWAQRHIDAVRELLAWLRASPDPDVARAATLRELLRRHRGERSIAFSEYGETVAAFYRALHPHARVAMLTHRAGRVAGGSMSRAEMLARFGPGGSTSVAERDRIDLLLATDVLSEGVNLQDASVLIHLDLAWSPARLEQRVGRLRRIGAVRDAISVYMFAPPAPAERLLSLERRLRAKASLAARSIGVAGRILPGPAVPVSDSVVPCEERIAAHLYPWLGPAPAMRSVAAAVQSERDAAIGCVLLDGAARLVAILDDRITDSPFVIEDLLRHSTGRDLPVPPGRLEAVSDRLARWLRRHIVAGIVDLPALRVGRARREVLRRVDSIANRLPRHARPKAGLLVHAARAAATVTLSAGAETVLEELARAPLEDEAWLRAIGEFAAVHTRGGNQPAEVLALLLLCRC
jgi:superfamily II DNA or RNA helicase